jgi:hypothetical protein
MRNQITAWTVICMITILNTDLTAQVYSNKVVGKKQQTYADSIKQSEYPYALPIWGEKATKMGFSLPYSAGLSVNYLYQKSDLVINNLQIGFNNNQMFSLDDIVRFEQAISTTNGANIRPDFWLFPFLNIYGILAKSQSSTEVDFSIYVPDGESFTKVETFNTKAEFDGTTAGFGLTPTIGVGGGFLALDMNFAWTDIDALEKPAYSFVFGPRFGKSFKFKNPESNLAVWAGGFRVKLNSGTSGSLPLNSLFNTPNLGSKVETGLIRVAEAQVKLDDWWNGLTPAEQIQNKIKYEAAIQVLDRANGFLTSLEDAVNEVENSTVQYSLDKKQENMWNFIIGSQYQINKHWMIRAEFGFLSSRTQFIGGLQYRFGL